MNQRRDGIVVVGIDGSDHSLMALTRAAEEAVMRGVTLHVVYCSDVTPAVLHLPGNVTVNTRDIAERERQEIWEKADSAIADCGATVERVDLDGYPADQLTGYCEENDAALLVLGTRGRGRVKATLLGSTSMRALEQAPCDVLIVKPLA